MQNFDYKKNVLKKKTVRLTNRENISQHATERTSKSSITKARQARNKNTLDQSTQMD